MQNHEQIIELLTRIEQNQRDALVLQRQHLDVYKETNLNATVNLEEKMRVLKTSFQVFQRRIRVYVLPFLLVLLAAIAYQILYAGFKG